MKYDELLNSRRIYKEKVSLVEIEHALERAERDLKTAQMIILEDWDWGFAVAYDAVLQASRAYMFSQGFRPASNESHKNTFAFRRLAMGKDYEELMVTTYHVDFSPEAETSLSRLDKRGSNGITRPREDRFLHDR